MDSEYENSAFLELFFGSLNAQLRFSCLKEGQAFLKLYLVARKTIMLVLGLPARGKLLVMATNLEPSD